MIKLDIICGLLGSGKTTLIKRLLETTPGNEVITILENEIGKINLDSEAFHNAPAIIKEITSGCICCTIKGNFSDALQYLAQQAKPDRIIVEPSGVADINALLDIRRKLSGIRLNRIIMIINGKKIKALSMVAGAFFTEQIRCAQTIYLNFTENMTEAQIQEAKCALWEIHPGVQIIHTPLGQITADTFPDCSEAPAPSKTYFHKIKPRSAGKIKSREIRPRYPSLQENAGPVKTWNYTFDHPFSDPQIAKLKKILKHENCRNLWRAKGYLKMSDHSILKIDLTYGDIYQQNLNEISDDSKSNILVMIGPNIPKAWLKEQFLALGAEI